MLLPYPDHQYCCRKGLWGIPFSAQETSCSSDLWTLGAPLSLEALVSSGRGLLLFPLPVPWSQPDVPLSLDWFSVPAQSGSKGKSCSGSWSWKGAGANPGEAEGILVWDVFLWAAVSAPLLLLFLLQQQHKAEWRAVPAACPHLRAQLAASQGQSYGLFVDQESGGECNTAFQA